MNSKIVIGTWPLSGDYGKISSEQVKDVLEYCHDLGINEFDTAPNYGNGFIEEQLGKVFVNNRNILINTKIGNLPFKKKSYEILDMSRSFEESLNRLNRDSVNILFLHNPRNEIKDYENVLNFFHELKDDKKIKKIGLSKAKNFDYDKIVDLDEFDVVQDDINLLSLDSLKQNRINGELMGRSPLASGLLGDRVSENTIFPEDDHRSLWLNGDRLISLMKRVNEIKKNTDLRLSELSIRFLLHNELVNKVIFGVKKKEHVDDILNPVNDKPLDQFLIEKIFELYNNDYGLIGERDLGY